MSGLSLYSYAGDFRALKALIAAQYNGVEIAKPAFELGKDNLTPEFLAKSPLGKVPVLDTPAGSLFESNAIAKYIARIRRDTELLGRSFFESAQVDAWLDFATAELELAVTMWVYPILGYMDFKQAVHDKAVADLNKALAALEAHLLPRTYLVGEAITLADIVIAAGLFYPYKLVLDGAYQAKYPSVTRWFVTCVNQPAFAAVLGEVALCTEPLAAAKGGKAAAAAGGAGGKAAEKKEKKAEEKPKKEAAPKAEKPKKEKEEDDGTAAAVAAEPKKVDPFASLPASPFILDEWKRYYSNIKYEFPSEGDMAYYKAMPWFWEKLDNSGWTLWHQKYKYNAENQRDFMTSNLVSGYIQRSDEIRKYAFGMMHVLKNEAPFEVAGVWLLRGDNVQFVLDSNPDAEYYEWVKLDSSNEEHRKLVADYWCAPVEVEGKPIYDSKTFK